MEYQTGNQFLEMQPRNSEKRRMTRRSASPNSLGGRTMKSKHTDDQAYGKEMDVTEEGIHSDPSENLDTGKRNLCSRGELGKMDTDNEEILDYCSHYGIINIIASCAHCNPGIYLDYITVSGACDKQNTETFPPPPKETDNLLTATIRRSRIRMSSLTEE